MIFDTWFGKISAPARANPRRPFVADFSTNAPPPPEQSRWYIGFRGASRYPMARLICMCGTTTDYELPGNGSAPVPNCCKNALPYPVDEKHTKHLSVVSRVPDGTINGAAALPVIPRAVGEGDREPQQEGFAAQQAYVARLVEADIKANKLKPVE